MSKSSTPETLSDVSKSEKRIKLKRFGKINLIIGGGLILLELIGMQIAIAFNGVGVLDNAHFTLTLILAVCAYGGIIEIVIGAIQMIMAHRYKQTEITGTSVSSKTAETTLLTIATVVLWVGIIGSVILCITGIALCMNNAEETGYSLLFAIIPLLALSIITWAVLKVLCNTSNNLREINQKSK